MRARPGTVEEAVELYLKQRGTDAPVDPRSFAAQFPELAPDLLSVLETLSALESIKSRQADARTALPQRIGPFRIVREIGRGGMGVVLEAIEEPLGRRVALKVLPPEFLASSGARARFRREAELASRLDHSGIATVYVAGVEDERPWIAMRLVEGETLSRKIMHARDEISGARRARSESPPSCVRLPNAEERPKGAMLAVAACIARVARALQAAHEQGVVHRDVKPSNIIIAPDGSPVLVDFGLAIPEESDGNTLTRTGETAGTPSYIAPEIVAGERRRPDAQTDVYALGVTLYECLALRRPFDAPTPIALYHAIVSGAPADLRAIRPSVPRDLAVIAGMAMERDRARRYVSAAALAQDLESFVAGRPIAARPVPLSGRIVRWARREPRQAVLATLLGLVTLLGSSAAGMWAASRGEVRAAESLTALRESEARAAGELAALREAEARSARELAALREEEALSAQRLTSFERLEMALQEGYGHLATNWLPEAEADFRAALRISPRNVEAIAGRAFVALKERRGDDVISILDDAPPSPAFDALRELAAGRPANVQADPDWFLHAHAVEMFVDGMRLMKQLEWSPHDARQGLARAAVARFDEAVKRSKTARMIYQVERAVAASKGGDESAARSAAGALVVLWPDQERALFSAGLALSSFDPKAAIALLEGAIALDAGWGAPHQVLGNCYYYVKDYGNAARVLRRAIEIDPGDADAYNSLGICESSGGCLDDARAAHLGAIRLRPRMFEAWANLALLEDEAGDHAAAESAVRVALVLHPRELSLRNALAKNLERRGALDEALAEAETMVGLDPRYAPGWRRLAELQARLGRATDARRAAEAGLELSPDDAELQRIAASPVDSGAGGG